MNHILRFLAFVLVVVAASANAHAAAKRHNPNSNPNSNHAKNPILIAGYAESAPSGAVIADTLVLSGANFVAGAKATLNGTPLQTFFINSNTLKVYLPPALALEGDYDIIVTNPPAGGGASQSQKLTIVRPANNPLAIEFSYTMKQTSYHELDSLKNIAPASAADAAFNAVRAAPIVEHTRLEGKIFPDGRHITTVTDITTPSEKTKVTTMPEDAANKSIAKTFVINQAASGNDTLGTVTLYDPNGAMLIAYPVKRTSYKTLIDSIRASKDPCAASVGAGIQQIGLPSGSTSMDTLIKRLVVRGASDTLIVNGQKRHKVTLYPPFDGLGLVTPSAEVTSMIMVIDAEPTRNYIESQHLMKGNAILHNTYYVPRAFGQCVPDYAAIINESYYTTPGGTAMRHVSVTEFESLSFKNYISNP